MNSNVLSSFSFCISRSKWQPDKNASACARCQHPFSMRVRRHHCRLCGCVVCRDCSAQQLHLRRAEDDKTRAWLLPMMGEEQARRKRVCRECYGDSFVCGLLFSVCGSGFEPAGPPIAEGKQRLGSPSDNCWPDEVSDGTSQRSACLEGSDDDNELTEGDQESNSYLQLDSTDDVTEWPQCMTPTSPQASLSHDKREFEHFLKTGAWDQM